MRRGKTFYRDRYSRDAKPRNRSESDSSRNSSDSKDSKNKRVSPGKDRDRSFRNNRDFHGKQFRNRFDRSSKEKDAYSGRYNKNNYNYSAPTNVYNPSNINKNKQAKYTEKKFDENNLNSKNNFINNNINVGSKEGGFLSAFGNLTPEELINTFVLVVKNISRNLNKQHLQEIFGTYGAIKTVEIPVDKDSKKPKGYAFVEYEKKEDAEKACLHMGGGQIDGQVIKIEQLNTNLLLSSKEKTEDINKNNKNIINNNNSSQLNSNKEKEKDESILNNADSNNNINNNLHSNKDEGHNDNKKTLIGKKRRSSRSRSRKSRSGSHNRESGANKKFGKKPEANRSRSRSRRKKYNRNKDSSSSSSSSSSSYSSSSRSSS